MADTDMPGLDAALEVMSQPWREWDFEGDDDYDDATELFEDNRAYPARITFLRDDMGDWIACTTDKEGPVWTMCYAVVPEPMRQLLDAAHKREWKA